MNQDQQKFVIAARKKLTPFEEAELYADALNNRVVRGLGSIYRHAVYTMVAQGRITKDANGKWYAVRTE